MTVPDTPASLLAAAPHRSATHRQVAPHRPQLGRPTARHPFQDQMSQKNPRPHQVLFQQAPMSPPTIPDDTPDPTGPTPTGPEVTPPTTPDPGPPPGPGPSGNRPPEIRSMWMQNTRVRWDDEARYSSMDQTQIGTHSLGARMVRLKRIFQTRKHPWPIDTGSIPASMSKTGLRKPGNPSLDGHSERSTWSQ